MDSVISGNDFLEILIEQSKGLFDSLYSFQLPTIQTNNSYTVQMLLLDKKLFDTPARASSFFRDTSFTLSGEDAILPREEIEEKFRKLLEEKAEELRKEV